ncbi:hypothetical protein D3C75_809430 [compost metagenome]
MHHLDDFPEIGRDAEVGGVDDQNRLGVRMLLQGAADGAGGYPVVNAIYGIAEGLQKDRLGSRQNDGG